MDARLTNYDARLTNSEASPTLQVASNGKDDKGLHSDKGRHSDKAHHALSHHALSPLHRPRSRRSKGPFLRWGCAGCRVSGVQCACCSVRCCNPTFQSV